MGANDPPGRGHFWPQEHDWQDLYRGPLNIATYKIRKLWALWFWRRRFFYGFPTTPRGGARMDPTGTLGRIYKEDHYTLLHTKYESSKPCGF